MKRASRWAWFIASRWSTLVLVFVAAAIFLVPYSPPWQAWNARLYYPGKMMAVQAYWTLPLSVATLALGTRLLTRNIATPRNRIERIAVVLAMFAGMAGLVVTVLLVFGSGNCVIAFNECTVGN